MSPSEFQDWVKAWSEAPIDANGSSQFAELAWEALQERLRSSEPHPDVLAAEQRANGLMWAAFWPSLAAVIVAAVFVFGRAA